MAKKKEEKKKGKSRVIVRDLTEKSRNDRGNKPCKTLQFILFQ